MMW